MRNVKTQPILVYKEIHKRLKSIAFEKNTSITKLASNIFKNFLELEDEEGIMINNEKEKETLKKVICQNLDLLFDKFEQLNKEEQELERDNHCFGIRN